MSRKPSATANWSAADLLGATPMDSPEGFTPNPVTGTDVNALTSNPGRDIPAPGNSRASKRFGHLLELRPLKDSAGVAHAAAAFERGNGICDDAALLFNDDTWEEDCSRMSQAASDTETLPTEPTCSTGPV